MDSIFVQSHTIFNLKKCCHKAYFLWDYYAKQMFQLQDVHRRDANPFGETFKSPSI